MGGPVRNRNRVRALILVGLMACGGVLLPGVAAAAGGAHSAIAPPEGPGTGDPSAPTAPTTQPTQPPAPTTQPPPNPVLPPIVPTAVVPPPVVGPTPEELAAQAAAAAAAKAAQLEAERQAKALAAAQKAAEQLAAAGVRAKATWNTHNRPKKLIIVRAASVDTVLNGTIQKHNLRRGGGGGPLSLADLAGYVPSSWLSVDGGKAQLSAMVVLSKGATLDIGSGSVDDVALIGGDTPDEAPAIYTGGGRLVVHDTTVAARTTDGAPMPPGPARPYIVASGGGTLDATAATFNDLGTPDNPNGMAGISFNRDSTGSLVRTQVVAGSIGVKLTGSRAVRLDGLTVSTSISDGIVMRGDQDTTLSSVRAEGNGGTGVIVIGDTANRSVTGISTTGNKSFGLSVVGQAAPKISGITLTDDGQGGLDLNHSTDAVVSDLTVKDEPIGVLTHVSNVNVTLSKVSITGGRRGVVVEKTTTGLALKDSTVTGAGLGVSVGGHDVTMDGVTVVDSDTAVALQRGAANVVTTGLKLSRGKDGFVANTGTTGVVLTGIESSGVQNAAVRMLSDGGQINGGQISGSDTGIHLEGATTITDTLVSNVDTGIRVRNAGPYRADKVSVDAVTVGVDAAPESRFVLASSRVHALESLRGPVVPEGVNDLSLPALSVLGAIGVPLIALALLLELIHVVRQRMLHGRGEIRRTPPPLPA